MEPKQWFDCVIYEIPCSLYFILPNHNILYNSWSVLYTVYPMKYAHGFVVLCLVVVMQSFIMNSHEVFIHIHQCCFAGTGAIARLPQCQWSKPDGYGKISQCITTTKHSKAKTVCIFLGIYCTISLDVWIFVTYVHDKVIEHNPRFIHARKRPINIYPILLLLSTFTNIVIISVNVYW